MTLYLFSGHDILQVNDPIFAFISCTYIIYFSFFDLRYLFINVFYFLFNSHRTVNSQFPVRQRLNDDEVHWELVELKDELKPPVHQHFLIETIGEILNYILCL